MSESIWDDPRITSYVLGEMPDQECREFEREIASNQQLAAAVDEARVVTDQLASLYGGESIPSLEVDRRAAIVAGGGVSPNQDPERSLPRIVWILAVAAGLLLIVGVMSALYRAHQMQQVAMSTWKPPERKEEIRVDYSYRPGLKESPLEGESESLRRWAASDDRVLIEKELGELAVSPGASSKLESQLSIAPAANPARSAGRPGLSRTATDSGVTTAPATPRPSYGLAEAAITPATSEPSTSRAIRPADVSGAPANRGRVSARNVEFVEEGGTIVISGAKGMEPQIAQAITEAVTKESLGKQPPSQLRERQLGLADEDSVRATAAGRPLSVALVPISGGAAVKDKEGELGQDKYLYRKDAVKAGVALTLEARRATDPTDFALANDEGRGPGIAGDRFEPITDNPFQRVSEHPLSTFSVDVDTASYSKVRDYLMRANQLPRPDAVRIEELLNYFTYDYQPPADSDEHPFAARVSVTSCPWNQQHRLARIALKGKTMEPEDRPQSNLVFLLDTSGSMNAPNKLPLVIEGMQMLLKQLNEDDKVAIAVYAGSAGLVLDSTPAKKAKKIRKALTQLSAGGSTNGGAGIALAYQTARDHFIPEGVNRVILCTDGDFNVGTTGTDALVRMVEKEAKGGIFLSVLGFGMGNHNDAMLEQVSGRGNGNYAFIDGREEAHKVLVEQASGTLVTIAKDVKLQIEFNPSQVASYRLIGYENRILAKEDFNDDKKDAGEIGAGHSVTALYEIVPPGVEVAVHAPKVDDLKYQQQATPSEAADSKEMLTLKLRYKQPDGDTSRLVEFPVVDEGVPICGCRGGRAICRRCSQLRNAIATQSLCGILDDE